MLNTPDDDGQDGTTRPDEDGSLAYLPHPYQALTGTGEIHSVNGAWLALLEYDRHDVVGDKFIDYLAPKSRETFDSIFRRFTSSGTLSGVELDVVRADGQTIPVTMDGRIEYDDDGTVVRAHCQFVDASRWGSESTTGRDPTEVSRETTATEESLKLAIEGAKIGVWDWDMKTGRVLRDELLTNMLGYSPSEMGDQLGDWERLVHPEGEKRHNEALQEHIENRTEYYECDYRMETQSGDWKWVCTMGTVVERDEDDTPVRAVGIHQDIDEQKRNHRKLARKTDQLEALNRVVRHDIRDQMSTVYGWAQELEHHVDSAGEDALDHVLEASQDVIDLTEVVRDIVESLESDDEGTLEPVNLARHLQPELERKRERYPEAEFAVNGDIPAVAVRANEMLSSVFRNLLANAVEHNDSQTPRVSVETTVGTDSVTVRFADNGPGIGFDSTDDIFESGQKGLESTGTGTGLYLVHSLVTEFGGDVWVENRAKQRNDGEWKASGETDSEGAVFVVELPKAE